jgi:hypothetical protein
MTTGVSGLSLASPGHAGHGREGLHRGIIALANDHKAPPVEETHGVLHDAELAVIGPRGVGIRNAHTTGPVESRAQVMRPLPGSMTGVAPIGTQGSSYGGF